MRVQTEEWQRFIPGVRMYKGKKTLFYNGEKLYDFENRQFLIYDKEERLTWEVIIVLPGVEVIPERTLSGCLNFKTVIMANTVKRIERSAFDYCRSLVFVKLSRNLEYIGRWAFWFCHSVTSIFIPPSCRWIDDNAFRWCKKMLILHVPQHTRLGEDVVNGTALIRASPFELNRWGHYDISINENVNEWTKNINGDDDEFALHRACSSYNPLTEIIYDIVKRQGLISFNKKNQIGVTPMQYLEANPFAKDIDQSAIMRRYVLEMMGEGVIEP